MIDNNVLSETQTLLKKGKIVKQDKKTNRKKYDGLPFISTLILLAVLLIVTGVAISMEKYASWRAEHEFQFPINWDEEGFIVEIKKEDMKNYPNQPKFNTPIEEYICSKFDPYDCKIAIAIAKAESGLVEDAWEYNTDGSLDMGIFQINSVNWGREGCSLKEITDPYKNVDCAYGIYLEQGWTPWSVYNSGKYVERL